MCGTLERKFRKTRTEFLNKCIRVRHNNRTVQVMEPQKIFLNKSRDYAVHKPLVQSLLLDRSKNVNKKMGSLRADNPYRRRWNIMMWRLNGLSLYTEQMADRIYIHGGHDNDVRYNVNIALVNAP